MEMMIHKIGGKLNKAGYLKVSSRFWRIAGMMCMAVVLAGAGCFLLSAQAAPATLKSPDATIYEQADEGSNAVGSLVEGSSFEYIGDVTAEDGSVWHQVTTANGTAGYIRGDRELELNEEEPVPESREGQNGPKGQDVPAEDDGDNSSAENESADDGGGSGENTGEAAGNTDEELSEDNAPEGNEDEETSEEGDGEDSEEDGIMAVGNMRNNKTKKYVTDTSAKVRERGSFGEINTAAGSVKSKRAGTDITLIIGIAVVFFSIGAIALCLSRMRKLKWETDVEEVLELGRSRVQRKIEKKKNSQKRKVKKK